ncbi:MAG: HNH endonuclease [Clostridia bacterium]|nr:HNH endonuclease [Clostridia bacterium]
MKILLPKSDMILEEGVSEIKDGKLYLYKSGVFKETMYKLSYMIFGDDECYYCHRKLRKEPSQTERKKFFSQISMDHVIPQDFGGPTITDNLRPACTDCNSAKGNMFEDEFREYRKIRQRTASKGKQGRAERRLFKEKILLTQELRRYGNIASLPAEWITEEEIKNVYVNFWLTQPKGSAYQLMFESVKKYNYLMEVATITGNGFLVDGFNAVLISKYYEVPIRAIISENVIYSGFPNEL